jgi:sulfatase maturation enzyme AslB (radical SAM superfamily)
MYWFRIRHIDALPPGRCYIYSAGEFGVNLYLTLSHRRQDIRILGFFDSHREGDMAGVPVRRFSGVDHDAAEYDFFVVAHEKAWQEIMYENTRGVKKPFYVALPECLVNASPARQNLDAYAAAAEQDFVPTSYCLQVSARCNSKCQMCPPQPRMKHAFMPGELVERILNEVARISPCATIYMSTGYGEPLINKDLEKHVSMAVDKGLNPLVATNAILLTRQRSQSLFNAGLKQLYCSFSGHNAETYQRVYGNPHFDEVTRNIADACAVAADYGPDCQVSHIGCIFAEDNLDFLRQAYASYDLLRRLGVSKTRINFGPAQNRGHLIQRNSFRSMHGMHSALNVFSPLTRPCHALASLGVNADGWVDLCYCSSRSEEDTLLGNIHESDLSTLAKSPKRINAFKGFRDMEHQEGSLCKYCDAPYLF